MSDRPDAAAIVKGALAGLAAGLVASFAMNQFQALTQKLIDQEGGGEPATVKAADAVARAVSGEPVPRPHREAAGEFVHYVLGGALGLAYGVVAELRPSVTSGYGTGFGSAAFALLDEAAVPATGLSGPPTDTPLSMHLYAGASHLVFGAVAEATRRAIRGAI